MGSPSFSGALTWIEQTKAGGGEVRLQAGVLEFRSAHQWAEVGLAQRNPTKRPTGEPRHRAILTIE